MGIAFLPALSVRSEVGTDDRDVAALRIAWLIRTVARDVFSRTLVLGPL